ncbi:MAG TPA: AgmX/PglI C-terminal domain-containing protein [Nannocystaceae bacterium]|nr:AgmX/PglI C-terminal domain-containing protein [Nannocystaceae bacterium]
MTAARDTTARSGRQAYGTRVALALGQFIVAERMIAKGGVITLGHRDDATFVVPIVPAKARVALVKRGKLQLLPGLAGRLVIGGREEDVERLREGAKEIQLGAEDWGVLWLADRPSVRLVVMQVPSEPLPELASEADRPLWLSMALSTVAIGLFLAISFLRYDPDRPELGIEDIDERFTRAMFNYPPKDEIPEEEPTISDKDEPEEKARKKAGGDEGKFGRPDLRGPSNVPRLPGPSATTPGQVGLARELLAQEAQLNDLLGVGGQISGTDNGPLIIGEGLGGMGLRGTGSGGGGEGEGQIHGTADVDMGGGGSANRKRSVKGVSGPAEKKPAVDLGRPAVKGQLSMDLIDKEVRRHKAQIHFCYQKQLTRFPNLAGKVSLFWTIAMDGSVTRAKVKSSSLGNSDVESCMVRALSNWRFPKPEGGVVEVTYPFTFGAK